MNEALLYFEAAPRKYRKMLFLYMTGRNGARQPETLAEYFVRCSRHMFPDGVEVWEFNDVTHIAHKLAN